MLQKQRHWGKKLSFLSSRDAAPLITIYFYMLGKEGSKEGNLIKDLAIWEWLEVSLEWAK